MLQEVEAEEQVELVKMVHLLLEKQEMVELDYLILYQEVQLLMLVEVVEADVKEVIILFNL